MYIGSPSIVVLPDSSLPGVRMIFLVRNRIRGIPLLREFSSRPIAGNRGAQVAEFKEQFWSNLFVQKSGFVYLMGTNHEYGRIVMRAGFRQRQKRRRAVERGVVPDGGLRLSYGTGAHCGAQGTAVAGDGVSSYGQMGKVRSVCDFGKGERGPDESSQLDDDQATAVSER